MIIMSLWKLICYPLQVHKFTYQTTVLLQEEHERVVQTFGNEWKPIFQASEWSVHHVQVPQQEDDFNCGVCICLAGKLLALGLPVAYSWDDIGSNVRKRMALDIIRFNEN